MPTTLACVKWTRYCATMTQTTADDAQGRGTTPTRVVATLVREARDRRGWTAQQLADKCTEAGMPSLDRSTVANIETGRRRRIGVDELLTLAYVLDAAPVHLLLPRTDDDPVRLLPTVTVPAGQARRWVRGDEQFPDRDERTYRYEVPDSEWERRSRRVRDAESRAEATRRRLRIARTKLDDMSAERGALDEEAASLTDLLRGGTPRSVPPQTRARMSRLDAWLDVAYDAVAEAKVDHEDAVRQLRLVRVEEGADDGERQ